MILVAMINIASGVNVLLSPLQFWMMEILETKYFNILKIRLVKWLDEWKN